MPCSSWDSPRRSASGQPGTTPILSEEAITVPPQRLGKPCSGAQRAEDGASARYEPTQSWNEKDSVRSDPVARPLPG